LYVLRSEDGTVLKTIATGGALAGGIVTYTVEDQQYVAVASGNISRSTFGAVGTPTIIVYALQKQAATLGPGPGTSSEMTGASRYGALCSSCHGTHGEGSIGPSLKGIAGRLTREQTIDRIKHPPSDKMPTLYPGTISDADVAALAAHIASFQ
jgi:alcohol dehydrogenase (cytochrome c)